MTMRRVLSVVVLLPVLAFAGTVVDQGSGSPRVQPWPTVPTGASGLLPGTTSTIFSNVWPGASVVSSPVAVASGSNTAGADFILSSSSATTGTFNIQCARETPPTVWTSLLSGTTVTSTLGTPGFGSVNGASTGCSWLRGLWVSTNTPQQRIVSVADVAGSLAGKYFLVGGAQSATFPLGASGMDQLLIAFWFKVSGVGSSPGPVVFGGRTYQPSEIDISTNDTAATIAAIVKAAMENVRRAASRSIDGGTTWTQQTVINDISLQTPFGAFGNGTFAFVKPSRAHQSTNGIDWTTNTAGTPGTINDATFAGGSINLFVAVGGSTTANSIWTSPDGVTWTARTGAVNAQMNCVAFDGTTIIALGAGGTSGQKSTDGITWNSTTVPSATYASCRHNGTNFAATVNGGTTAASSSDGTTWVSRTQISGSWLALGAKTGGGFVAAQSSSTSAQFSPDGITWTAITLPLAFPGTAPGFSNSMIFYDPASGRILMTSGLYSTDGVAWSSAFSPAVAVSGAADGSGTIVNVSGSIASNFVVNGSIPGILTFVPGTSSVGATPASAGTSGFTVDQIFPSATLNVTMTQSP